MVSDSLSDHSGLTLELCARMPFISAPEISALSGVSLRMVQYNLKRFSSLGYVGSVSYSGLDARVVRRWHMRSLGVSALAEALGCNVKRVLSEYPVSLHWQRRIIRRIDSAAVFYSFAVAASLGLGRRCEWRWRNQGWNDGCLDLGGGRFVHAARIGSGVSRAALASRLGSMVEEANALPSLVDTPLFIAPSFTDMRYMERWLRDGGRGIYSWVARESDVLFAPDAAVWLRPSTLWVQPNLLVSLLSNVGALRGDALRLAGGLDGVGGVSGRRLPVDVSEMERERLVAELSVAGKRLLFTVADWPLASSRDLALIANMKRSIFFVARRELLNAELIRDVKVEGGKRCVLTDEGLRAIAWRDRVGLGTLRKQWRSDVDGDGRLMDCGGKLLTLRKKIAHTDGSYKFAGMLSAECATTDGVELLELLPEHRSERWFVEGKRRLFGVRPDMSGAIRYGDEVVPFMVEYEMRGIAPSLILGKLRSYQRYYRASLRLEAWSVNVLTLFVFSNSAMASRFVNFCERDGFDLTTAGGLGVPIYVAGLDDIERLGALGEVWFRVRRANRGRVAFLTDGVQLRND